MAWPAGQGPGRIKNGGAVTREYGSEAFGWTYGSDMNCEDLCTTS